MSPGRPPLPHPSRKQCPSMGTDGKTPIIGWRPLWSKDRTQLVQIFTDLDTGSILTATVSSRRAPWARWESTHEVGPDHPSTTGRDHPHNGPHSV